MCALYEFTINKICCIKIGGGERGGTLGTRRGENVTANVAMTVNMINMKPLVEEKVYYYIWSDIGEFWRFSSQRQEWVGSEEGGVRWKK